MRRLILIFFAFLVLGVGLSLAFRDHNGYLLIAFGEWRLETSLLFAVAVLIFSVWALLTLWHLVVAGVLLPRTAKQWLAKRRARKARRSRDTGLLRLLEGRWAQAESELTDLAESNESPQLNYLAAARAAQHLGATRRRDEYLEKAAAQRGSSEMAVLLTQAELQIAQGQDAEALASLSRLREMDANHPYVLSLLVDLCERLQDWVYLREILSIAAKEGLLTTQRWIDLSVPTWNHSMTGASREKLESQWKAVPKRLRREPAIVQVYARHLRKAGCDAQAAIVIEKIMKSRWDARLTLLYGELKTEDQTGQLAAVEGWLKQYGDEPELLLVAGRLCLRNRLWGRARSYFENSLTGQSRPDALLELGRLLDDIDQEAEARQAYRQGLELVVSGKTI